MGLTFHPDDYYDINKSVVICGATPPDDPVGEILRELDGFARSLEIHGLTSAIEEVASGGLFCPKCLSRCHRVEVAFGPYRMRMLTSARKTGNVVSLFSYESFHPRPISQDMDYAGTPIVDLIAASLKRLEDVEFFLTMDQVFDFIHNHAVEKIRTCSRAPVHTTSARTGWVGE